MGIAIAKQEVHGCLVVRVSGSIDLDGANILHDRLEKACDGHLTQNVLFDVEHLADIDLTYTKMADLIGLRRSFFGRSPGSRIAIWAPSDMTFGMSRMYAALLAQFDNLQVEVFRCRVLAAEHLGLPPDLFAEAQARQAQHRETGPLPSI